MNIYSLENDVKTFTLISLSPKTSLSRSTEEEEKKRR
jgi:hypothetical protein